MSVDLVTAEAPTRHTTRRCHRLAETARRHWLFATVLLAGLGLRFVTQLAYRPALLYVDSWDYLSNVNKLNPAQIDPLGYSAILLHPVLWVGNLATVAALQHLLGLAMGVAMYVVLVRRGVRLWLATLAAVPVLLEAYQVQIEHNVMSDTLFEALVLAGVLVLLGRPRPTVRACVAAGVLFGVAVSVREVGIVLVVPGALFVLWASVGVRWARVKPALILVGAFAAPVILYGAYFASVTGHVGLTGDDVGSLYGRAVSIADCRTLRLPSYEQVLCPSGPPGERKGDEYAHNRGLVARIHPPAGMTAKQVERNFALRVFAHQPVDLVEAVVGDFTQGFSWSRTTTPNEVPVSRWQFQLRYPTFPGSDPVVEIARHGGGGPSVNVGLARFLRGYQLSVGYVPGPFLAAGFLLGLLGATGVGRSRRSNLRAACLLVALSGLGLLLAANFFEFSWRYQLPALLFALLAGGLGLTALLGPRPALLAPSLDDLDETGVGEVQARS